MVGSLCPLAAGEGLLLYDLVLVSTTLVAREGGSTAEWGSGY